MSFYDHPEKFDVGFLAALFAQEDDALRGFDFAPVGTGQVGDSYRVTLDWAVHYDGLPKSLVVKCPLYRSACHAGGFCASAREYRGASR